MVGNARAAVVLRVAAYLCLRGRQSRTDQENRCIDPQQEDGTGRMCTKSAELSLTRVNDEQREEKKEQLEREQKHQPQQQQEEERAQKQQNQRHHHDQQQQQQQQEERQKIVVRKATDEEKQYLRQRTLSDQEVIQQFVEQEQNEMGPAPVTRAAAVTAGVKFRVLAIDGGGSE